MGGKNSGAVKSSATGSGASNASGGSNKGASAASRFTDIPIQETELFGPGMSTEGPGSSVTSAMASGSSSGSSNGSGSGGIFGEGSSKSGGIDPYTGFISPGMSSSGPNDLLSGLTGSGGSSSGGSSSSGSFHGSNFGEGSRAGGIGSFGNGSGGMGSGKDGVDIGFGSGPAGSGGTSSSGGSHDYTGGAGGKPYEPLAEVARLKPFEPTEDLQDIHFDYDKYDLDAPSKSILNKNAEWLKQNPSSRVEVQGHCDERGTNNYNLGLGERRAIAIKKYLIARGISRDRLFTISYGEERPFCQDSTETCWKSNRRGHFLVSN